MPLWVLSNDRWTRGSHGRPTFTYASVPADGTVYDRVNDLWGLTSPVVAGAVYDQVNDLWGVAAGGAPAGFTRPTGPGIYAVEDIGVPSWSNPGVAGITAALAKVATLGAAPNGTRTITLPEHVFSFDGFAQSQNYLGLLVPPSVGIVGSGPGTIFEVARDSMTQAQSNSWERYGLSYGNVNLMSIMLTQASPAGTQFGQFHVRGQQQKIGGLGRDHYHNGWTLYLQSNPLHVFDVLLSGVPGYYNTPPGETFSINLNNSSNVTFDRCEIDGRLYSSGAKVAACMFGANSANNLTFNDCYAHHAGFSHGFGMWQARVVRMNNCVSEYNGTAGNPGTVGDGFNFEKTWDTAVVGCRSGFNTLAESRYYSAADGDGWSGETGPHTVTDHVITDGGQFNICMDGLQRSVVPTFTRSPTPVYKYG